ncbi:FHA domain-containing protein [Marinimicrobium alkaliphilum]|uniref:FHA domain-containing protein n=1 Tax=Marinimicrobium alkaliphilum TaxID=2202654 RepID=UPI000DB948A4|nr:FHA domain-containing protein [Marinimicrobium alkaliphilum]
MLKIRSKDNKHSAVWLVEPGVTIGRLASNDLIIDDRRVAEQQLEVRVSGDRLTLVNREPDVAVAVNGKAVIGEHALVLGDTITLLDRELQVIDPKQEHTRGRVGAVSSWSLKANHTALAHRVFPLAATTLVGRARECDITLGAAHLSRRHAELRLIKGLLYVKDLDSSNGTFVNGKRVTEARVRRGDELRFDTLSFGVLGPSEELDKTTVRPRGRDMTGSGARTTRNRTAQRAPRAPQAEPESVRAPSSVAATSAARSGSRHWWGAALGVSALVAAMLVFFVLHG